MFKKILIANRGEIACRIITTTEYLGIQTVAVYSEADEHAQHVLQADEAYLLGPAPSRDSYLCIDKIIAIAKQSDCEAIHPGYGFLSENPDFAEACQQAGLIFIGPTAETIRAMGIKSTAKEIVQKAGVPVVSGYAEVDQNPTTLRKAAEKLGFPVILKAAAGGGGKGLRVVHSIAEFDHALESAKREALASFNSDLMLIEKYIHQPRHIEVQIFGDQHGNIVHLGDRDCSIQRRHQKILEEAPAPGLSDQLRAKIHETAIKAAKAVNYIGAGTVEFLVTHDQHFYFMEMNTRLQVEHPVTEMITDLDLVEWQLRVAAGEPLPLTQDQIQCQGHAIEVRLCAEDPARDFLPSIGKLSYLDFPHQGMHTRIDSGVIQGDSITPYYDSMIAKLIVHDDDRETAITRLIQALKHVKIAGVHSNIDFLRDLCHNNAFQQAQLHTGFIEEQTAHLNRVETTTPFIRFALVALFILGTRAQKTAAPSPFSAWITPDRFRLNSSSEGVFKFIHHDDIFELYYKSLTQGHYQFRHDAEKIEIAAQLNQYELEAIVHHRTLNVTIVPEAQDYILMGLEHDHRISLKETTATHDHHLNLDAAFRAPLPGTVVAQTVKINQPVKKGAPLLVIEAMKMEHTFYAPEDGFVETFHFETGCTVNEGDELLIFKRNSIS